MSWPCCPVCKLDWRFARVHMDGCPWEEMEKRVKALEDRCATLMRLVQQLDERTVGSMRF